jgi:hypothetical protein
MGLRSLDVLQQLPRLSDQRLNLFPLFDRAPRKQAMLERVSVLFRRTRPRRARGLAPFEAVPELLLGGHDAGELHLLADQCRALVRLRRAGVCHRPEGLIW